MAAAPADAGPVPNRQKKDRIAAPPPEWSAADPDVPGAGTWVAVVENGSDESHLTALSLEISPDLGAALFDWNEEWCRQEDEPLADAEGWLRRGIALAEQLQSELDGIAEVRPEFLW